MAANRLIIILRSLITFGNIAAMAKLKDHNIRCLNTFLKSHVSLP